MKLKEKVDFIINKLEEIYPVLDIPLDHKDPYTLLIAVLMSAQSTDKKVNEVTPILFSKADNPYDMIKLSIECLTNDSQISSIELKFISGEIFTAIGKLDCNFFFSF